MMKRFKYGLNYITLFLLFGLKSSYLNATSINPSFSFPHPYCKVKHLPTQQGEFLYSTLNEMSKKRRLKLIRMKDKRDIYKGEMYFRFKIARIKKKLYDHCQVDLELVLASEDRYTSSRDQILYSKKSKRSLPRITLKGNERCHRALKDAFIHIPTCLKQ